LKAAILKIAYNIYTLFLPLEASLDSRKSLKEREGMGYLMKKLFEQVLFRDLVNITQAEHLTLIRLISQH
jgi:hypothetical protein